MVLLKKWSFIFCIVPILLSVGLSFEGHGAYPLLMLLFVFPAVILFPRYKGREAISAYLLTLYIGVPGNIRIAYDFAVNSGTPWQIQLSLGIIIFVALISCEEVLIGIIVNLYKRIRNRNKPFPGDNPKNAEERTS